MLKPIPQLYHDLRPVNSRSILTPFTRDGGGPGESEAQQPGLDPLFSSVQLLAHFDGSNGDTASSDSSNAGRTLTFENGATLSDEQAKFGTTSLKTAGTEDGRASITPVLDTTQTEWTFECWAYLNTLPVSPSLDSIFASSGATIGTDVVILVNANGAIVAGGSTDRTFTITTGNGVISTNTWYHFALTFSAGDVAELFVDGVSQGTGVGTGTFTPNDLSFFIGDQENTFLTINRTWDGFIDEFRFTAARRYTTNFTPPTEPFPDS